MSWPKFTTGLYFSCNKLWLSFFLCREREKKKRSCVSEIENNRFQVNNNISLRIHALSLHDMLLVCIYLYLLLFFIFRYIVRGERESKTLSFYWFRNNSRVYWKQTSLGPIQTKHVKWNLGHPIQDESNWWQWERIKSSSGLCILDRVHHCTLQTTPRFLRSFLRI